AMATPSPPWTDTRVERLVVAGGSIAIPPAPPGTAATVNSVVRVESISTTDSPAVRNKFPAPSKARSFKPVNSGSRALLSIRKTTPEGAIAYKAPAPGSVTHKNPKAPNARRCGCAMPDANVVLCPSGVIFLIELALPLLTKRFPLESKTIVSGSEIVTNVFSVKMTSSVEENSKMTSWRRAPTNKLVVAAYPVPERNNVAKQAPANL